MADSAAATHPTHRRTITLSTVVSVLAICGVILPLLGALSFPFVRDFISKAAAGEVKVQVQTQLAPV